MQGSGSPALRMNKAFKGAWPWDESNFWFFAGSCTAMVSVSSLPFSCWRLVEGSTVKFFSIWLEAPPSKIRILTLHSLHAWSEIMPHAKCKSIFSWHGSLQRFRSLACLRTGLATRPGTVCVAFYVMSVLLWWHYLGHGPSHPSLCLQCSTARRLPPQFHRQS